MSQSSKCGKDRQEVRTEGSSERTNTRRRKLTNEAQTVGNCTASCFRKKAVLECVGYEVNGWGLIFRQRFRTGLGFT